MSSENWPKKGENLTQRALVTGANGFVGSHLTEYLLSKGYHVRCLVRKTSNLKWLYGLEVEYHHGDVRDKNSLAGASLDCDYVFHVAGVTRGSDKKLYFDGNFLGTKNLLEVCLSENPTLKRFVYVSSQAAVGPNPNPYPLNEEADCHPITPYGRSKLEAEKIVLQHKDKMSVTIIRPPAVYGPRDDELFLVFKLIDRGIKPHIGFKESLVSICYIADLVEGIVLSAESQKSIGQIYFIADQKTYSWKEATSIIAKALDKRAISIPFPRTFILLFAHISEVFGKVSNKSPLLNHYKANELLQRYWICDISRAKIDLGFEPRVGLQKGSEITIQWYRSNNWL